MCCVNPKWSKAGSLSLGWLVDTMDIIRSFDPRARQTNVRPLQRAVCPLSDNLAHVLRWSGMIDRKSQGWELFWELNNFQGRNLLTIFFVANSFCYFWSSWHFGQNLIFCGQKHTKNVDNNNEKRMFRPVFCAESENGVQNPLIWKLQLRNVFFGCKLQIKNGVHLQHTIRCTKK